MKISYELSFEYSNAINQFNDSVSSQNQRGELANSIINPHLKELARNGLIEEQTTTIRALGEVATRVNFDDITSDFLLIGSELKKLTDEIALLEAEKAGLYSDLDIALKITPDNVQPIQDAAKALLLDIDTRIDAALSKMHDLDETMSTYLPLLETPWNIPRVINPMDRLSTFIDQSVDQDSTECVESAKENVEISTRTNIVLNLLEDYMKLHGSEGALMLNIGEYIKSKLVARGYAQMDSQEYVHFKTNIGLLLDQIIDNSRQKGIPLRWYAEGRNKGKRYFIVGDDREVLTDTLPHQDRVEIAAASTESPNTFETIDDRVKRFMEIPLSRKVYEFTVNIIRGMKDQRIKHKDLLEIIEKIDGIKEHPDVGTVILEEMQKIGLIYCKNTKGSKYCSLLPQINDEATMICETTDGQNTNVIDDESTGTATESGDKGKPCDGAPDYENNVDINPSYALIKQVENGFTSVSATAEDVVDEFGKTPELKAEIMQWLSNLDERRNLCNKENQPMIDPKIKKLKSIPTIQIGDQKFPVYRFSPPGRFSTWRIAFCILVDRIAIYKILPHDKFDQEF